MEIQSSDIVRLVQAHLLEAGLSSSVQALQHESGIRMNGQLVKNFAFHASAGNWGAVLESLSYVDPNLIVHISDGSDKDKKESKESTTTTHAVRLRTLIADVHEMTILELAEAGELALACATFRIVQKDWSDDDQEEEADMMSTDNKHPKKKKKLKQGGSRGDDDADGAASSQKAIGRTRLLEQKLAALAAYQANHPQSNSPLPIPDDYYHTSEGRRTTKQQRRDDIGRRLDDAIPVVPKQRLVTLLQQAVSWQSYTGQLPTVQRLWNEDDDDDENDDNDDTDPSRKKKKRKGRPRREFDLVLGTAMVEPVAVGSRLDRSKLPVEPVCTKPWSIVKLGKRTRPESAIFAPDGKALVTGSSDGLIEVWGANSKYESLLESLEYQKREELMGHDNDGGDATSCSITALAVSNDGQLLVSADASGLIKVWNMETGRCLRSIRAHSQPVIGLCLAPDASHLLTSSRDGTCREFGLRTSRMLKEFGGGGGGASAVSSVSHCSYRVVDGDAPSDEDEGDRNLDTTQKLLVVTASSDGAVRIWDRASQELIRTLRPVSIPGRAAPTAGSSMVVADSVPSIANEQAVGSPPIQAVLHLHTPRGTMIIVPRGPRAYLVDMAGTVMRVYDLAAEKSGGSRDKAMVAATVSCTNQWLYAATDDGTLCVFSVESGKLETSLPDFGDETKRMSKDSSSGSAAAAGGLAEITGMLHHPNRSIVAAFSNSKSQKKGQVVLWK